ncbi:MAG TPA: response regulator transcription factor [Trebonia sp.]|jgi:two-component system nitrate/nitrite response regulator NarL|nr:response regulator transcription factor [Trebonia sp.]
MRLVLCDDNRILCEAFASVLQARGHHVLAIATHASEGVAAVCAHKPDACLLDVRLPDGSGIDAAQAMRKHYPDAKIVMLSCLDDLSVVSEAKKAGVVGFLRKDQKVDAIVRAVEVVGAGGLAFDPATSRPRGRRVTDKNREHRLGALTRRETEVLQRIVAGQGTRQMASEMGVTINSLRSYVKSVLTKLGVHSRLEAAAIASNGQYGSMD